MKQLLAGLPEDAGERAARARRRALARLGADDGRQKAGGRRLGWWVPALAAMMILVVGVVWFRQAWRVETLALQAPAPVMASVDLSPPPVVVQQRRKPGRRAPAPERLQVQLALSDGTQVYWTFDHNFKLGGTL